MEPDSTIGMDMEPDSTIDMDIIDALLCLNLIIILYCLYNFPVFFLVFFNIISFSDIHSL